MFIKFKINPFELTFQRLNDKVNLKEFKNVSKRRIEMVNHCDFYEYRSALLSGKDWCLYRNQEISRDVYKEYCEYYSSSKNCPFKMKGSSTGCFLTTACVRTRNLPDDCYELECLRGFRDSYVAGLANGQEIIKEYYDIAPKIIESIYKRSDADSIFRELFEELVEPCVYYIERNQNEAAYALYERTVLNLKNTFLM